MKIRKLTLAGSDGNTHKVQLRVHDKPAMQYAQDFLPLITGIQEDFSAWTGYEKLLAWIKRQPWHKQFFGHPDKIPSRLLYPEVLAIELSKYLDK